MRLLYLPTLSLIAATAALLFTLVPCVHANPWESSGQNNVIKFEYRDYSADHAFSPNGFGTSTQPSSSHYLKQEIRLTGHTAVTPHWIFFFDLRAAHIRKIKSSYSLTASGPEDQQLGMARVFDNHPESAQAIAMSLLIPTGSGTLDPALSTGQHAVEFDYWLWHRLGDVTSPGYVTLALGPRLFLEGGAAQIRLTGLVGGPITPRLSWIGSLFLSRTLGPNDGYITGDPGHNATNYNVLRPGVGVTYHLMQGLHLELLYEKELAGRAQHAGQRLTLGLSLHV